MFCHRVPEGIGKEDHDVLKKFKILETEVRGVMLYLFELGCPKPPAQSLKAYLQSPPLNMSVTQLKKKFNKDQINTIDAHPGGKTGKSFDISLLSVAIDVSVQGVSPQLEGLVTENRKLRNTFLHEDEKNATFQQMEDLVEKTYREIGKCYAVDVTSKINLMKDNIDKIKKAPLPVTDIIKYQQDLKTLQDNLKIDFLTRGQDELVTASDTMTKIDPVSFISGRTQILRVENIFTRIDLIVEESHAQKADIPIQQEQLFTGLGKNGTIPQVVVLEGPSGSGKTTLTKLVHAKWVKHLQGSPYTFINLNEFDLIFNYECSNSSVSSYKELIENNLPNTTLWFRDEDILKSVRQLKILILVDAADDLNENSKSLLREIIDNEVPKSGGNLRLLCTTRPQALEELQSLTSKLTNVHTKITGISSNRQEEFVTLLHNEMKRESYSTKDTEGLIRFLKSSKARMGDHFKFPLILTLITYLWAVAPKEVNEITTVTYLYFAIHRLIKERLFDRLNEKLRTDNLRDIKTRSLGFLKVLYQESLRSIGLDAMVLPDRCTGNLKKAADDQSLPHEEVFAAFLSVDREWTPYGYCDQLAAPHKSIMEFYGGYYIYEIITEKHKTPHQLDLESQLNNGGLHSEEKKRINMELDECKTVNGIIKKMHKDIGTPLAWSKYENVLVHLIGLLANEGKEVLTRYHVEIITLLKESVVRNNRVQFWFQVIHEAKLNSDLVNNIGQNLTEKEKEHWSVNQNNLENSLCLLKIVAPKKIRIEIKIKSNQLRQHLSTLCRQVAENNIKVVLTDEYAWRNGHEIDYISIMTTPTSRCVVKELTTTVNDVKILPTTVEDLRLGIPSIDGEAVDPGFNQLTTQCPELEDLSIHLSGGTGITRLPQLPDVELTTLVISQLRDVAWLVDTAVKLQPPRGYVTLVLPTCQVSGEELMTLPAALSEAGVKVWGDVRLASPHTAEQAQQMEAACREAFGYGCYCRWYDNDEWLPYW